MEPKLNFQVPAEGLEILILLKTVAFIEIKTIQEPQKCLGGGPKLYLGKQQLEQKFTILSYKEK